MNKTGAKWFYSVAFVICAVCLIIAAVLKYSTVPNMVRLLIALGGAFAGGVGVGVLCASGSLPA